MAPAQPAAVPPVYDTIGRGYATFRRTDPRIEQRIHAALGDARRVLNVGAGSGSYEPAGDRVVAVEPSPAMIGQRSRDAAPVLRAVAGALPFPDGAFEAAMAVLTVHHWPDPVAALAEVRRVTTGPVVIFTFDKGTHDGQWLNGYLPGMAAFDQDHLDARDVAEALGGGRVEAFPVPFDCLDGFCHAWWRRPDAYLDPAVRAGISGIARLPADVVDRAMARLARDLSDGTWQAAHGDLMKRTEIDAGYRIVVSPGAAQVAKSGLAERADSERPFGSSQSS